jgi:aminopeptidase N
MTNRIVTRSRAAFLPRAAFLLCCALPCSRSIGAQPAAPTSAAQTAPARDSLLEPGVSVELARYRAQRISDVRYALELDVTRRDTATGRVTIQFTRRGDGDAILDFRGHGIDGILVNGARLDPRTPGVWNRAHVRMPAALLKTGSNSVRLTFATPIAPAGASIIRARDATDGNDYLYTLLVPSDANLLFPCFDQPDLKARVSLSVTAPPSWNVLGNGRPVARDSSATRSTHRFAETRPLSTYLIAFAAGPWSVVTRNVVIKPGGAPEPLSLWTRASRAKEAEHDSIITMNARALTWLGDWFGTPYPFDKYAALLAPAFPFGGMEHPGAVFFNEESFIYRERPTVSQLLGRQATVYHEVAHQWFGDYVTMGWFDDLWLKEGFATYMAARMQASLDPASNAWKTFYLRNKPVAYGTDATAGTTPVWQSLANLDQAKSNYGPIVYNKAPGVLKQLEYTVGATAFQNGVQSFLREHAYANATWRDLLRSIGTAAGRDLTSWGEGWILRPGMPIVEQQVEVSGGRIARLRLTQRPAQPTVSGPGAWPLATQVVLFYENREPIRIPVTFTSTTTTVSAAAGLPAPAFVFANDGDYAHALVLPDSASVWWLDGNVVKVKDDLLRAMLWGSLWDLVREARLSPVRYIGLALANVAGEPDEQVASGLVGRVSTALARYVSPVQRDSLLPLAERAFLAGAADSTKPYGVRKAQLDAVISLARSPGALGRLDGWLRGDTAAALPLRAPTRWAIVTRLVARDAPGAATRLAEESRRDSTTEGKRLAFVAAAARGTPETKRDYFSRWFNDRELNEEWVTSSLRAFHEPEQRELTRPYLVPALDTLPWIQANRRIFFLGSWLGATIGGQTDADALRIIDDWLKAHPALPLDLRQKILQTRDDLERTVAIRRAFP